MLSASHAANPRATLRPHRTADTPWGQLGMVGGWGRMGWDAGSGSCGNVVQDGDSSAGLSGVVRGTGMVCGIVRDRAGSCGIVRDRAGSCGIAHHEQGSVITQSNIPQPKVTSPSSCRGGTLRAPKNAVSPSIWPLTINLGGGERRWGGGRGGPLTRDPECDPERGPECDPKHDGSEHDPKRHPECDPQTRTSMHASPKRKIRGMGVVTQRCTSREGGGAEEG